MFWTIVLGIIVGGVALFVILRNWQKAKALAKLLLIGLATFALLAVAITGVTLLIAWINHGKESSLDDNLVSKHAGRRLRSMRSAYGAS
jgi:uncharacterized membrane protein YqjE